MSGGKVKVMVTRELQGSNSIKTRLIPSSVSFYSIFLKILYRANKANFPSSLNSSLCILASSNYEFFVGFKSQSLSQGNMAFSKTKTYFTTITMQSFNFNLKIIFRPTYFMLRNQSHQIRP